MSPKEKHIERLNTFFKGKGILNKDDVASYLGVSLSCVKGIMDSKTNPIKFLKLGNNSRSTVRFDIYDFAEYLSSIEVQNETQ